MKGILLAGGHGTRLRPLTTSVSKQLLPVYDKPMVYYSLSVLMLAGINDILIISTPRHLSAFHQLLKNGSQWGIKLSYAEQEQPRGLADAFRIGRDFINKEPVCLILGDNIFFGHGLPEELRAAARLENGAEIFAYRVRNPKRYGVVDFDGTGRALSLEEKPENPSSNYAVPGIYFYDHNVVEFADNLKPSPRGELEITDLNKMYLNQEKLRVRLLGRGIAWLDAGTNAALMQASNFVQAVQDRQGMMISCPEEIAYRMNFIDKQSLRELAMSMSRNSYQSYLLELIQHNRLSK